jgi:hypothetical protein
LAAQALHPVPPSLAVHATTLIGSKAASTSLIAKGALHAMTAAKIKATVAITAAVLLVGAAVPIAYHYATARPEPLIPGPPPQSQSSLPSITPLPPLPAGTDMSRPVTGSLPPGMTAEPIAIMDSVDKRWIHPTGEEITNLPTNVQQFLSRLSRRSIPGATHAFVFRVTVPDTSSVSWRYSIADSNRYGTTSTDDFETHSNYTLLFFAPGRGANNVTLTVDAADGPWTNHLVIPASATSPTNGSINGVSITFGPPTEQNNQVQIQCPKGRFTEGMYADFYGIDSAGNKKYNTGTIGNR